MREHQTLPRTVFLFGNSELDAIALQVVWERDPKLKLATQAKWPELAGLKLYDHDRAVAALKRAYFRLDPQFNEARSRFVGWWRQVEQPWLEFLGELFPVWFPSAIVFSANIGIAPICPRDLVKFGFLIPWQADQNSLSRICAHEISHFFFYGAVARARPKVQPAELHESRHWWLLSEILVPLLFGDERSVRILGPMPRSTYACSDQLVESYRPLYTRFASGQISLADFLDQFERLPWPAGELDAHFL